MMYLQDVFVSLKAFTFIIRMLVLVLIIVFTLKQDDFLPRTATPLEDIFKSLFW